MLVLVFGNTTHSVVAVVSAFLAGLAIGNYLAGKRTDGIPSDKLLWLYSRLEFGIGLTAITTLPLLNGLISLYPLFSDGTTTNIILLLSKFVLTAIILIVPTALMGATLPTIVSFVETQYKNTGANVSLLYGINTFGAIIGVLMTGFVLIELTGLTATLFVAAGINISIGLVAYFLKGNEEPLAVSSKEPASRVTPPSKKITILILYAVSGLTAIAYQVLWTRILTPRMGTFIYAFTGILALYLLGIAVGSWIFNLFFARTQKQTAVFAFCQVGIALAAFGSVYLPTIPLAFPSQLVALGVILPATVCMGISFPAVVLLIDAEKKPGNSIGLVYFWNTLGSILGGFVTSFLLIPALGSSQSVLFLSIINLLLAMVLFHMEQKSTASLFQRTISWSFVPFLSLLLLYFLVAGGENFLERKTRSQLSWVQENGITYKFQEDEVASVFGYNDKTRNNQNLLIDGVATTSKVAETKLMAHLPLALHPNPRFVLIVAFGMGATFRSALLHDVNVDAIELVPSVPQMFTLFHTDAEDVLKKPNGKIIINDGRNYIVVTKERYDVVTIDPPPPFNAAGTTVLYAKEFYEHIREKLTPNGLVSQWVWFGSREDDVAMVMKSFAEVFPSVLAFRSMGTTGGVFMIGSAAPIELNDQRLIEVFGSSAVQQDLAETNISLTPHDIRRAVIANREKLLAALKDFPVITDTHPRTEYYLLRHHFTEYQPMTMALLLKRLQR